MDAPAPAPATAVVDARPVDHRETRLCTALLGADVRRAAGVGEGDVVRLRTSRGRTVLCRVGVEDADLPDGAVRVDRFSRQALKAYPHEEVTVERVAPAPAAELALLPAVDPGPRFDPQVVPTLKRVLAGQEVPVRAGMLLHVRPPDRLAGAVYEVHAVTGAEGGPVRGEPGFGEGVVGPHTTVWLVQADHHHGPGDHAHDHESGSETVLDTTFEDVGGLAAQIRAVREYVELPLVFPQVYRQLGINPPRGVVFHGAPGTGKTLLARSVAHEVNAALFYVNGPEIVGTFSGETEANLRSVFAEASQSTPAIILVDEVDAIAPARRTATSSTEARTVAQLLALLDGLQQAEGVLVIGTTNRVEAIDPALRRAGRFDREVHFPTPDAAAREQILRVQTREMPLDDDAIAALPAVAERAHGFVGADLMELGREAGLNALRRASGPFLELPSPASAPRAEELVVTREDLEGALRAVQPAALRESLITYPAVGWSDIGGLAEVKARLRDLVGTPLRRPDLFARVGLPSNLGVLLHGPAGTGKTLLAQAVARESGVNFLPVQGPELFSQWLGESEESVRHVFDVARRAAPCIVFFDQLDAVLSRRGDLEHEGTRAPQRVVNQLLAELDGMAPRSQVLVMGATNRIGAVDPAALRPGRFGVHLHVGVPDAAGRSEVLRIHLAGATLAAGLSLDELVEHLVPRTEGRTGADLAFLVQNAKLSALDLTATGEAQEPALARATFDAVLPELPPAR